MSRWCIGSVLSGVLVAGAALGAPQLQVYPPSALRGEIVMLHLADGSTIRQVSFGPKDDENFNRVNDLKIVPCPSYLKTYQKEANQTGGECVKIPGGDSEVQQSWGGPQELWVGASKALVVVFGENVPSPKELGAEGPASSDNFPFQKLGWQPPVKDLRRSFVLWFPKDPRLVKGKYELSSVLYSSGVGELESVSAVMPLGGGSKTCNGFLKVFSLPVTNNEPERLGYVLEQVNQRLKEAAKNGHIEAYTNANSDPISTASTPSYNSVPQAQAIHSPATRLYAPRQSKDGAGITIAVLDTGVTVPQTDRGSRFEKRLIYNQDKGNFTDWISPKGELLGLAAGHGSTKDDFEEMLPGSKVKVYRGHGSVVAALAAGNDVGIAPGATILPIKVCTAQGMCPTTSVIQGICYALKSVPHDKLVLNLSLGGDTPSSILSSVLQDAIEMGVPVVASMGNMWSRRKGSTLPESPDKIFERVGRLNHYPANARDVNGKPLAGVIGVGAVGLFNSRLDLIDFSQEGVSLDVFAPGVRLVVRGVSAGSSPDDQYSGTSFAAPLVAGALAVAKGRGGNGSPRDFEQAIKNMSNGTNCAESRKTSYLSSVPILNVQCFLKQVPKPKS